MKKIISICVLCLFMAMGSYAAKSNVLPINNESKKVTITLKITEDNLENTVSKTLASFSETFPIAVCWATIISETPLGPDMYGNLYFEVVIEVTCIIINI